MNNLTPPPDPPLGGQVDGTILNKFYSLGFVVQSLHAHAHAQKFTGGIGLQDFSGSPMPLYLWSLNLLGLGWGSANEVWGLKVWARA